MRTFSIPLSSIKVNGKKINYFDFISSLENADCNKALKRILPKINMDAIFRIVDDSDAEIRKHYGCRHGKSASLIFQWKNCGKGKRPKNLRHGNK